MSGRYSAHPDYQDSGLDWLGRIPKSWELRRLGSYFRERRTKVSDAEFSALSVTMQGIVPQLETAAKTNDGDNRKLVRAGDFVINSRSDRKGSSGVSSYDGSVSLISIVLKPLGMHPPFAHHLLRSSAFQEEFYRFGKGIVADLWSTNYAAMKNIVIPVMPAEEQIQIAKFLDYETAKIDALIEKQQQLIALLKEKRQAVISHAVTKGLNPDAPMRDSGVEWLGEIPAHWDVRPFRHALQISNGQVDPRVSPYSAMPLVAPNHIESGTGRLLALESAEEQGAISGKYEVREGDVIYSKIRPALRKVTVAPEACLCSADMYALRPTRGGDPAFFSWLLLSEYFSGIVVLESMRVAMPKVNRETLAPISLPVPDSAEQRVIAGHLSMQTYRLDALVAKASASMELLQERRTALISAAVTGKIDVRDWTPPPAEAVSA